MTTMTTMTTILCIASTTSLDPWRASFDAAAHGPDGTMLLTVVNIMIALITLMLALWTVARLNHRLAEQLSALATRNGVRPPATTVPPRVARAIAAHSQTAKSWRRLTTLFALAGTGIIALTALQWSQTTTDTPRGDGSEANVVPGVRRFEPATVHLDAPPGTSAKSSRTPDPTATKRKPEGSPSSAAATRDKLTAATTADVTTTERSRAGGRQERRPQAVDTRRLPERRGPTPKALDLPATQATGYRPDPAPAPSTPRKPPAGEKARSTPAVKPNSETRSGSKSAPTRAAKSKNARETESTTQARRARLRKADSVEPGQPAKVVAPVVSVEAPVVKKPRRNKIRLGSGGSPLD